MTSNDGPRVAHRRELVFLIALCLVASALLLTHLTRSYLWNDEGSTVLLARTVLAHGIPMHNDGQNSTSAEHGTDFTASGIYKYMPWLQFYVAAASFAVLGESTFSARLPFALFGIGTILLTYFLARDLWKNRAAAETAAVILALSVPFLLLAGQSRYYALCAFFATLALWQYIRILDSRKYASAIFVVASVLLLQSNQGHGIGLLMAVSLHAAIWRRDRLKVVFGISAAIGALSLPWLLWMSGGPYGNFSFQKVWVSVWLYLLQLLLFVPHAVFPIAAAFRRFIRWKRGIAEAASPAHAHGLMLCLVAVMVPLMAIFAARPHFRYLAPLLPIGSVFAGKVIADLWQSSKAWTVIVTGIWLLTGLLPNYLFELNHEYKGPVGGMVRYLNEHAKPGDLVVISYEDLPLKFYTPLRVIGGYADDDMSLAKDARWIIPRKYGNPDLRDALLQQVAAGGYKKIVLDDYPDDGFENRESPMEHNFSTVENQEPVVIYERVAP